MKRTWMVVLLVNLLLSACAPVTAPTPAPSATPMSIAVLAPTSTATPIATATATLSPTPTDTATPSPTPSPTATATPTPIPTLPPEQVGGLSGVPDPRLTNPELFDLTRSDAPIPQFVNAMRMAGIEITGEQVLEELRFEHRQYPVRDENGNVIEGEMRKYVFGVWDLPAEMLLEKYRDLAGPVPIVMGRYADGKWKWENYRVVPLRAFADVINLKISNLESHYDRSLRNDLVKIFNSWFITWYLKWDLTEPTQGKTNYSQGRRYVEIAKKYDMDSLGGPIIYQSEFPVWLTQENLSDERLEQAIRNRVRSLIKEFIEEINYWIVVNEYHPIAFNAGNESNFLYSRLGSKYVEIAYDEARTSNPNATLIYNDNAAESPNGNWYRQTYDTVRRLKQKNLVDAVGFQAHINQPGWTGIPSEDEFRRSIISFRRLGVEVYLTEMDITTYGMPIKERFLQQAAIYQRLIRVYLEETKDQKTRIVSFFGLRDSESWFDEVLGNKDADPLLFDDNGNAKISYYAILSLLYEKANEGVASNP